MAGTLVVGLLALLGAVGCGSGSGGSGTAIASTPLAGKIGGQSWSLGTAQTNSTASMGSSTFFVEMYPDIFSACTGSPSDPNENQFLPSIPRTAGDYSLSLDLIATFVVGGTQNLGATSGHLVIDSATTSTITGGINTSYNSDNSLDGQFTIVVCP